MHFLLHFSMMLILVKRLLFLPMDYKLSLDGIIIGVLAKFDLKSMIAQTILLMFIKSQFIIMYCFQLQVVCTWKTILYCLINL